LQGVNQGALSIDWQKEIEVVILVRLPL
jgi:hypothetical protein